MGISLKKISKKARRVVKKVGKAGKRVAAGVVTGGLSETKVGKNIGKTIGDVLVPTSLKDLEKGLAVTGIAASAVVNPLGTAAVVGSQLNQGTTGGTPMGLGNVLGGLQGVLGTVSSFGGPAGTVAQIGSGFLSGFLPAQGPRESAFPQQQFPQAQQTMAMMPQAVTGALATISPILQKIGMAVGRNVSFRAAMIIIRRLLKTLGSPQAVAAALGIALGELSAMLVANSVTGSSGRRMNPGNVKALRRAHRRIKSFHKLCGENDRLRAPRRRSSSPKVINVKGGVCS